MVLENIHKFHPTKKFFPVMDVDEWLVLNQSLESLQYYCQVVPTLRSEDQSLTV